MCPLSVEEAKLWKIIKTDCYILQWCFFYFSALFLQCKNYFVIEFIVLIICIDFSVVQFIVLFSALLLMLLNLEDKWLSMLKLNLHWLLSCGRKSCLQPNYILLDLIGWSKRKDMGYDQPGIKSCILVSVICWLWPIYRGHKFVARVHRILFIYGKLQSFLAIL